MTSVQKVFPAMGTVHTMAIRGDAALSAAERIRSRMLRMDRLWSVFREDSEISRLNRNAGNAVPVHEETLGILKESVRLTKETSGAFDVTAGDLTGLWRQAMRAKTLPQEKETETLRKRTGAQRIRFSGDWVTLGKGQSVDLGGIAKGWALDRALEMLKSDGISRALLNFGGTVGTIGEPVMIGIRDPFDPDGSPMGTLLLDNRCAVTSGSYERFAMIGTKTYHHIIDPRTGYPSDSGLVSVTLIGNDAARLDALATGAFILGIDRALPVLKRNGVEAVFVRTDGTVFRTGGLKDTFRFQAKTFTAQERKSS